MLLSALVLRHLCCYVLLKRLLLKYCTYKRLTCVCLQDIANAWDLHLQSCNDFVLNRLTIILDIFHSNVSGTGSVSVVKCKEESFIVNWTR
jgi:hypothetical protein